ncbi:fe2+ zn2+ uptake regulation protein [Pseudomonas akapageensis]|uniref:fe2+ zn2+ uptake regulation protein n=1 Tax=Pseudomonas akapageensis TaxID=2609961 RepID=UPI001FEBAE2A|nr:fe2+ zn2+ uptake regulation protein [Pseudomonas akapageensis]
MYDQPAPASTDSSLHNQIAPTHRSSETGRSANEQIRELLRRYGLRTSLIRLKVIDVLLVAARNGRPVGVRGVHAQLEALAVELSFLSVREVLKRLCSEGVIRLNPDKSYSLTAEAQAILEQRSDS